MPWLKLFYCEMGFAFHCLLAKGSWWYIFLEAKASTYMLTFILLEM